MPQTENRCPKTAVIGGGAMGSLFGALLAEGGADVWLLDVWEEHVRALRQTGLHLEHEGATRRIPVKVAVIFVKSGQTESAARSAASLLEPDGLVVTLQNGLGNADTIAGIVGSGRVAAGVTAQGATVLGPGKIRHGGTGPTRVGMWRSSDCGPVRRLAAGFNAAGIETVVTDAIHRVLWDKLLVNVGINAVTALTGICNGQLLELEVTRDLCRAAVEEAAAVARAKGIQVRSDAADHVLRIARATAANRSSMGQDVDRRRQTEIEAINGVIVREARKAGLDAPVNRTLAALVKTLQAHYPR